MAHTAGDADSVNSYLVNSAEIKDQAKAKDGAEGYTKFGAYLAAGADRVAAGLVAMTAAATIFMA